MKRFWKRIKHKSNPYTPPKRHLTVVIPGNYRQFGEWCYKKERNPYNPDLLYIGQGGSARLRGIGESIQEIWFVGTYRQRRDIDEVIAFVEYYQYMHTDISVHFDPWRG